MRGHDDLIKMRMAGKLPPCVCLYDMPFDVEWRCFGDMPRVCVAGDHVVDLDLRLVFGMTVFIECHDMARADLLLGKCVESGAIIVAASAWRPQSQDPYNRAKSTSHIFYRHFGGINDNHHYARYD